MIDTMREVRCNDLLRRVKKHIYGADTRNVYGIYVGVVEKKPLPIIHTTQSGDRVDPPEERCNYYVIPAPKAGNPRTGRCRKIRRKESNNLQYLDDVASVLNRQCPPTEIADLRRSGIKLDLYDDLMDTADRIAHNRKKAPSLKKKSHVKTRKVNSAFQQVID